MATYRKATDDDFGEDGKGKPDFKFYESQDGLSPTDPNTPATNATKETKDNYVVENAAAAEDAAEDAGAVETPAADAGSGPGPTAATAVDAPQPPPEVQHGDETEPKNELFKALEMVIRTEKVGLKDGDGTFIKDPLDEKVLSEGVALFCKKYGGAPEAAADKGGRRRTKRKGRKGSKKGAKKSKTSAKQSKKGGRSRKNRRKQSRRRKH
jgi:hypothetical protein